MKLSGPDHPISIALLGAHVTVRFAGTVIAESDAAPSLKEANYPEVVCGPRGDLRLAHFHRTDRSTHCPHKSDASYSPLEASGQQAENAAWSYEAPFPATAEIKDCAAVYPGKAEIALG